MVKSKVAILNEELCKGCKLCVRECPVGAITELDIVNKNGYEITTVDEEKCIGCGMCYRICPDYVYTIIER
ncbi:4Fe-4S binding protein [Peptoniphilus sp. AGMB00490]|uniref:4Fe-4S binding protein n=1 Tax=Peptoniphilus faecalis TaxID=2731255 RepID=A0A848RD18_9FIRM|nr:4Fe-4S binding protein [Peptoniphilus faecalis]NMW85748.1 4Fe-4S binding protein [Peptoniphilus faecalis]